MTMNMDIFKIIERTYGLTDLNWKQPNSSFTSNRGNKLLRFWHDETLLDWHITWRDEIGKDASFAIDRMIRTQDGEPAVRVEGGFMTLHDDIPQQYVGGYDEEGWGELIGRLLQYGTEENEKWQPLARHETFSIVPHLNSDSIQKFDLLKNSVYEAKRRTELAEKLRQKANGARPPIMDPIRFQGQGRQVFDLFYWVGGTLQPELGYYSLRGFLLEWLNTLNESSLDRLLSQIENHFSLRSDQGYLLLAEIMTPWEWSECLSAVEQASTEEEVHAFLDHYKNNWELNRRLLQQVADWIDESRKKVAQ
jgi:hypothetical protein